MKTVIFTDLDGTFLNHDDYSFEDLKESLELILNKNIPLIFTTSKTKIEVELLQKKVGIVEPFIVENGAALFVPKNYKELDFSFLKSNEQYYILELGLSYKQILNFYNRYKVEFEMRGFSDMSDEEVSSLTGLDLQYIQYCKKRDYSEPFILNDETKLENLKNLAATYNIKITKGGRFYHLMGEKQDKGKAVSLSINIFSRLYGDFINSIALGDGVNDIEMLESVKVPIIIKSYDGTYLKMDNQFVQKSTFCGSKGWNEMVLKNV